MAEQHLLRRPYILKLPAVSAAADGAADEIEAFSGRTLRARSAEESSRM
jgi:hypothetical protein